MGEVGGRFKKGTYVLLCCAQLSDFEVSWTEWSPSGSSVHGISQARIWNGNIPSPGDLPDLGVEPSSLTSPALAGRFLTTEPPEKLQVSIFWKAVPETHCSRILVFIPVLPLEVRVFVGLYFWDRCLWQVFLFFDKLAPLLFFHFKKIHELFSNLIFFFLC